MSEISDLLTQKAEELKATANETIGDWQMVKSAALTNLNDKGVDLVDAERLLDTLADKADPGLNDRLEKSAGLLELSDVLEKTAQYIDELELKLSNKEKEIEGMDKAAAEAVKAPSVEALTGTGVFTNEDLEALNSLDQETLQKVAGLADNQPWNLGGPSDRMAGGVDAFTEFLTS